jgi:hypothetical protein
MSRDVGLGQLVQELEQRGARLPFEIGAFVALEACEGLLKDSVKLEADDVRVTLEGSIVVSEAAQRAEPSEAARSLVSVLARLLVAAGPGVPPDLLQLVKESTTGQGPKDLRHLHDAIEASLIPINRGASRRVLARLVRESDRPPAPEADRVDRHELDAELDELLRDPGSRSLDPVETNLPLAEHEDEEPVTERIRIPRAVAGVKSSDTASASFPPPVPDVDLQPETVPVPPSEPARRRASMPLADGPASGPEPARAAAAFQASPQQAGPEPITATIRKWQPPAEAEVETEPSRGPAPVSAMVSVSAAKSASAKGSAAEPAPAPEAVYDRSSLPAPKPPGWRIPWKSWLVAGALGLGVYSLIAMGAFDGLRGATAPTTSPAPRGVIEVTVTPADAQVFLFVGRGPAVAAGLPTTAAHEFVVFDRGLRPSRAIVPAGATWTSTATGPLYELAVQAEHVTSAAEALDLGVPQTAPAAKAGESGTIRIITNPPGAKVYRFVGIGPRVKIPASSIHEGQELLVYHPNHEPQRAVVGPSDWQADEGAYKALLDVELPMLPGSAVPEALQN